MGSAISRGIDSNLYGRLPIIYAGRHFDLLIPALLVDNSFLHDSSFIPLFGHDLETLKHQDSKGGTFQLWTLLSIDSL